MADRLTKFKYQTFQCFQDAQTLIKNISHDLEKVLLVIDALDECKDPVNLLESVPSNWHVFITCLSEGPLREAYGIYGRLIISATDNVADIRRSVQMEVRKIKVRKPELASNVVDVLTSGAEGW